MVYGTGGVAIANWDAGVVKGVTGAHLAGVRSTNFGVAASAGIEYTFNANLIGRAGVLHYSLQRNNLPVGGMIVFDQLQTTTGRFSLAWVFH